MKSSANGNGIAAHASATKFPPSADEQAGMDWWHSLSDEQRKRWADRVGAGDVADAWQAAKISNAEICFGQIADLAHQIDREHFHFGNEAAEDDEAAALLLSRARETLLKIGWLADLGTKQLTGRTNNFGRESAADWLMVPIFDRDVSRFVDAAGKRGAA